MIKKDCFQTYYLQKPLPYEEIYRCKKCNGSGLRATGLPCYKCCGAGVYNEREERIKYGKRKFNN